MAAALWTPEAQSDLEEIVYYIAIEGDRPLTGERIAREIRDTCDQYAEQPLLGEARPGLGEECRILVVKRWVIIYRPFLDGIAVLRVVDGSRDFDKLFGLPL